MNYKYIVFLSLSMHIYACKEQKCDALYKYIFTDTANKDVYYETYSMGKDAIPCLIKFIDMNKKSAVGFQDPQSSNFHSFSLNNYIGIDAAYLIELILSKDSIEKAKREDWQELTKAYRIYGYGVIIKTKENKPVLKSLEYSDMKSLKEIYLKWWQINKEKPIEQLRNEWKKSEHIITNSGYEWI